MLQPPATFLIRRLENPRIGRSSVVLDSATPSTGQLVCNTRCFVVFVLSSADRVLAAMGVVNEFFKNYFGEK